MIGSLRGRLLARSAGGEVLVEVGGLGYRVQAGPATAARLGDLDTEVFVWIHHHIRDDAQALYGFASDHERDTFEALLGAHGVGPALALAILSVHPPAALARIVSGDDLAGLCLVPGVGRKTAARLLIELKSRLDDVAAGPEGDRVGAGDRSDLAAPDLAALADVRDALAGLGYGSDEIAEATRDLKGTESGTLLRQALQSLSGGR